MNTVFDDFDERTGHMRWNVAAAAVIFAVLVGTSEGYAQRWSFGGNIGLSLLDGSPGFHVTPTAELLFNQNMGVGSELSANTQYSAPVIWHPFFKYYIGIRGSPLRPFASAGPLLAFNLSNGSCFGFLFGGGVNIPIANRLYLAPNFLAGAVFGVGGGTRPLVMTGWYWGYFTAGMTTYSVPGATIFAFTIRVGIRYEI